MPVTFEECHGWDPKTDVCEVIICEASRGEDCKYPHEKEE